MLFTGWVFGLSHAQSTDGLWKGQITQYGRTSTYLYDLELHSRGSLLSGRAVSTMEDGRQASFEVEGTVQGDIIFLEEVKQLLPQGVTWCMKKFRLEWAENQQKLTGVWTAKGCQPGTVALYRARDAGKQLLEVRPSDLRGNWSGHLSQSDRLYGFFYSITFPDAVTGQATSHILSEGEGGSANHRLTWSFDSVRQQFTMHEYEVFDRSQPDWLWCYKKAELTVQTDGFRYWMEGRWWGKLIDDRVCAPGTIYLEKEPEVTTLPDKSEYEIHFDREMNVLRTLKTDKDEIDLFIWDNNILDGDIITMYWNDEEVLSRYRLSRGEKRVRVKLERKDNYLVLHAENTGDISPNTAAVRVDYGDREEVLVLSSNFQESGALFVHKVSRE